MQLTKWAAKVPYLLLLKCSMVVAMASCHCSQWLLQLQVVAATDWCHLLTSD